MLRQVADLACYIAHWGRRGGYSVFYSTRSEDRLWFFSQCLLVFCLGFSTLCLFVSITNRRGDFRKNNRGLSDPVDGKDEKIITVSKSEWDYF